MIRPKSKKIAVDLGPRSLFTIIRDVASRRIYPAPARQEKFLEKHWNKLDGGLNEESREKLIDILIEAFNENEIRG